MLSRPPAAPIRADLIAFIDAVELELFDGGHLRRRWRFLRDAAARRHADRLRRRLERRGYFDRRGDERTTAWAD